MFKQVKKWIVSHHHHHVLCPNEKWNFMNYLSMSFWAEILLPDGAIFSKAQDDKKIPRSIVCEGGQIICLYLWHLQIKCLIWHHILKVECLEWDQTTQHFSPSIVDTGGQKFSLFIFQLSSLLNYWLSFFTRYTQLSVEELKSIICHLSASNKQCIYHYFKTTGPTLITVKKTDVGTLYK